MNGRSTAESAPPATASGDADHAGDHDVANAGPAGTVRPVCDVRGQPDRSHRGVVSFVRRRPRLTPQQQKSWDKFSDRWLIDVPRAGHRTSIDPEHRLDPAGHFGRSAPLIVEIGPGMGESLVPMAAARPGMNVLAFEVYPPAIAKIFAKIARRDVDNVRLIQADAVEGLRLLGLDQPVSELWTFFPDPWHKTKHHKRRLVTTQFADLVASRMQPQGVWRLATDWADYANQMRDVLEHHDQFHGLHPGGDAPRWAGRPVTRFEQRGIDQDRQIFDFAYRRC